MLFDFTNIEIFLGFNFINFIFFERHTVSYLYMNIENHSIDIRYLQEKTAKHIDLKLGHKTALM